MKIDIILERRNKNLCPICNQRVSKEVKSVVYKSHKVFICDSHYVGGKE